MTDRVPRAVYRPGTRPHYGLIAQEVKEALNKMGVPYFAGFVVEKPSDPNSRQSLRYEEFIAPLMRAVQELAARVVELEARPS